MILIGPLDPDKFLFFVGNGFILAHLRPNETSNGLETVVFGPLEAQEICKWA
jgi:hypothetical protein